MLPCVYDLELDFRCVHFKICSRQVSIDAIVFGIEHAQRGMCGHRAEPSRNGGSFVSSQYTLMLLTTSVNVRKSTGLTMYEFTPSS